MRKYHFTAITKPRVGFIWPAVDVEGWVFAKSLREAEAIIVNQSWKLDSLTQYKKSTEFQPQWRKPNTHWVDQVILGVAV